MDHKVSKDMISSGMIPSGEKTQADLGRIQYGSAPSPSALMDAYRSIYEHHQKDKDGNTIPHQEDLNEGKIPAGLQAYLDKKKGKKEDKKEVKEENVDEAIAGLAARGLMAGARGARVAGKLAAQGAVRARQMQASGGFRKAVSSAAQKAAQSKVGQGIKKTVGAPGFKGALAGGAIGGAVGAGLMSGGKKKETNDRGLVRTKGFSNYDLNFDYTPEGDVISEDFFDLLKVALVEEGCDESTAIKLMASATPEFFEGVIKEAEKKNLSEAIVTGSILAGLAAKKLLAGALVKKGAALAAKSIAKKGLVGAAKAGSKAFGAGLKKGVMTAGKTAGKSITTSGGKVIGGAGKVKQATGLAGAGQRVGQGARALGAAAKNNPTMTALTGVQVAPMAKDIITGGPKMPKMPTAQRAAVSGRRTAGGLRMDLDLFDVVKGKLLDEGLTEEECTEVMTTLTLDEIQESIGKMKLFPTAALLGGAAAATQQIASRMGKKSGEESIKPKKSGLIKKIKDRTDATNKAIEQM